MTERQLTIARPVTYSGIGLHTGDQCHMTFVPAAANTGIRFVRTDLAGRPSLAGSPSVIGRKKID